MVGLWKVDQPTKQSEVLRSLTARYYGDYGITHVDSAGDHHSHDYGYCVFIPPSAAPSAPPPATDTTAARAATARAASLGQKGGKSGCGGKRGTNGADGSSSCHFY